MLVNKKIEDRVVLELDNDIENDLDAFDVLLSNGDIKGTDAILSFEYDDRKVFFLQYVKASQELF